jgi:hypothetical protein
VVIARTLVAATLIALSLEIACSRAPEANRLPARAERVFSDFRNSELISLEPEPERKTPGRSLHGWLVLGSVRLAPSEARAAAASMKAAITGSDGSIAACFEPRHALRTQVDGHIYEALICYSCGGIEVYEDGKYVGGAAVAGSPDSLNRILKAGGVPISHSGEAIQARMQAQYAQDQADRRRWVAAMPSSVRIIGDGDWTTEHGPDLQRLERALAGEFPQRPARILALLGWYGSGVGRWSGYPVYEELPDQLLHHYPTREIIQAMQSASLTEAQTEGAARFLADYNRPRSSELASMPQALRSRLLTQALKTKDAVRIVLAREIFDPRRAAASR